MKGKLLKAFLIMCLCLMPTFGVSAADSEGAPENKYLYHITASYMAYPGTDHEWKRAYTITFATYERCYLIQSEGFHDGFTFDVVCPYDFFWGTYIKESTELATGQVIRLADDSGKQVKQAYKGANATWLDPSDSPSGMEYYTDLPIFDKNNTDAIKKYLETGDVSGAENEYDISQPDQDDSVELPKNVRTYGSLIQSKTTMGDNKVQYSAMTVRWDPPGDIKNYSYDVKIQCTYSQCVVGSMKLDRVPDLTKSYLTAAKIIVQDYPYETNDRYDINTGKPLERDGSIPEDVVLNRESLEKLQFDCEFEYVFPTQVKIWIRNRLGNKCSNWVAVSSKANNVNGSDSTARVEDDNGNKVDDDNYNDTPIDNSDKHTYYDTDPDTSSAESPKFSLKEFYSYLKSGFGLLGNNGLIAFFAKSFSFIPSNIWSLITGGVAVMIVVGIINFALKR